MILKSRRILAIYYMWTKTKLNATSSVWIKRRKNVFLPESFITWTKNLSFFYLCSAMILFTVGFLFQIEKNNHRPNYQNTESMNFRKQNTLNVRCET